jgi:uncharacterized membrane protein YphA (DoxX/SURF4 family)
MKLWAILWSVTFSWSWFSIDNRYMAPNELVIVAAFIYLFFSLSHEHDLIHMISTSSSYILKNTMTD